MPNAVETLSAAKQAGLRLALDGADLIVAGFKRLDAGRRSPLAEPAANREGGAGQLASWKG